MITDIKYNKFMKILKISIMLFCLFFNSCIGIPFISKCKMYIEIDNNYNGISEIKIVSSSNTNEYNYFLSPFENKNKKRINFKRNEGVVLVKTEDKLLFIGFGEYDHWFSMDHIIKIEINNDEFKINVSGMGTMIIAENHDEYNRYINR